MLTGYADRLEIDDAGRVVVVDFKTGTHRAHRTSRRGATSSSALYQYAVDTGALDESAGAAGRASGGAELVQLGIDDDSAVRQGAARSRPTPTPDRSGRRSASAARRVAADLVRAETFPAVAGPHCRDCPFVAICPAKGAGSGDRPVTRSRPWPADPARRRRGPPAR